MKTGKAKLFRGYDQNSNLSIFVDKDITMLSKDLVIKSIDTLPQEFTIDELIEQHDVNDEIKLFQIIRDDEPLENYTFKKLTECVDTLSWLMPFRNGGYFKGEKNPPPEEVKDRFFEETCARDGRRNFVLSPNQRINIDLGKLNRLFKKKRFGIQSAGQLGTAFKPSGDIRACILKSGIMIAQTPPDTKEEIKDSVFEIYRSIMVDGLDLPHDILPDIN